MPHVIFELSDNISETNLQEVLAQIQQILVDTLPTELSSCKSRVVCHQNFLVGNGDSHNAFIHLSIEILAGRSKETLDLAANKIMRLLKENFKQSQEKLNVKISISIKDLPAAYYRN